MHIMYSCRETISDVPAALAYKLLLFTHLKFCPYQMNYSTHVDGMYGYNNPIICLKEFIAYVQKKKKIYGKR